MCIAELNVSLLPCRHRWYHLLRPCSPSTNLSNCPSKLSLEGWEIKCDFCPYCATWNLDNASYRLVGNDRSPSVGGLSRTPSVALSSTRRESRRSSLARTDSSNSVTMMAASEKNRAINARINAYLSTHPERILQNDPSLPTWEEKYHSGDDSEPQTPTTDTVSSSGSMFRRAETMPPTTVAPAAEKMQGLKKSWKRHSKKLGMSFFR